jgi:hypothetical protein
MTFNPRAFLLLIVVAAALWVTVELQAVSAVDYGLRLVIRVAVLVLSVAAGVGFARSGQPLNQVAAYREFRRWFRRRGEDR